jgi:hypothetical protein
LKKAGKSNAKRRGGARPGAGRPAKPRAPAVPLRISRGGSSAQDLALKHLGLAIETLSTIAGTGASEAARVAAARFIVETATGRGKAAAQGASEQPQDDDDWGDLIGRQSSAGRAN